MNQAIQEYLADNITTTSQIYWGHLPTNCDYSLGSINFFRLPSQIDWTSMSLAQYQFSVRDVDILRAYEIKEELINLWVDYQGFLDGKQVQASISSEQGELWEDDDRIAHLPIIVTIKYIR